MFARTTKISLLALSVAGALASGQAHAAAFQLKENSAKGLGRAFAGSISAPGDASVVFSNPAAMSGLNGMQLQTDVSLIRFGADFKGTGTYATGATISGGNGGDAGEVAPVPAFYFHVPFADNQHFGASLTVPFGFKTEYDKDWVGRYSGTKTDLKAIDLAFAYSYDVNPYVSFGANVFAERLDIKLAQAINFGAALTQNAQVQQAVAAQVQANPQVVAAAQAAGQQAAAQVLGSGGTAAQAQAAAQAAGAAVITGVVTQQLSSFVGAYDGYSTIEGDETSVGFTLGALLSPDEHTHIGISYRSKVTHDITNGKATYEYPEGSLGGTPVATVIQGAGYVNANGKAQVVLPASATISVTHDINEKWTVMADVSRTQWKSAFNTVTVDYDSAQADSVLNFHYDNTTFGSIGAEYHYSNTLTFRSGVAYDQTPTSNEYRDVRVPDVTRKWLSLGLTWAPSAKTEWSVGYTHLFVSDSHIDTTSVTGDNVVGAYDVKGDILAASFNYKF